MRIEPNQDIKWSLARQKSLVFIKHRAAGLTQTLQLPLILWGQAASDGPFDSVEKVEGQVAWSSSVK